MSQICRLHLQSEIKCSLDSLFDVYKNRIDLLSKICPDKLKSIQVLEGDGKSVGSVRLWTYVLGDHSVVCKDKIVAVDELNRSVTFDIVEGEITKYFRSYKATIQLLVDQSEVGKKKKMVKWCVEYEKMSEAVPDPTAQVEFLMNMAMEVDTYLLNFKH